VEITDQQSYRDLEVVLEKHRKLKSNLLVVTVPGTGLGHFFKIYKKKNLDKKFDVIKLDWAEEGTMVKLKAMIAELDVSEKVAASINYPKSLFGDLATDAIWNHFYGRYYFGAREKSDVMKMVDEMELWVTKDELERIWEWSGGLAQIVKYLVINKEALGGVMEKVLEDEKMKTILNPLALAVSGLNQEIKVRLNLVNDGNDWRSGLLKMFLNKNGGIDIRANFDLSFSEDGEVGKEKLSRDEKMIIEAIVSGQGKITKEKIAELKWGEGKYDKFSDQAIGKAMRRLSQKLNKYEILTIPRVGYMIERK